MACLVIEHFGHRFIPAERPPYDTNSQRRFPLERRQWQHAGGSTLHFSFFDVDFFFRCTRCQMFIGVENRDGLMTEAVIRESPGVHMGFGRYNLQENYFFWENWSCERHET